MNVRELISVLIKEDDEKEVYAFDGEDLHPIVYVDVGISSRVDLNIGKAI